MQTASLVCCFLLSFSTGLSLAQSSLSQYVIGSGGQVLSSDLATYSATLGEAIIFGGTSVDAHVCQGFQSGQGVVTTVSVDFDPVPMQITFYPNPTADVITIQCELDETLRFDLCNVLGQWVASEKLASRAQTVQVSLQHLETGLYALFAHNPSGHRRFVDWIIVQRS